MSVRARVSRNGHANRITAPADAAPVDFLGIPLPHDLDAERSLLCSMMLDTSTVEVVDNIVISADFHAPAHAIIFRAIVSLHVQGVTPDAEIVYGELKRLAKLDDVGGLNYLLEVSGLEPHAGNAAYYAEAVRELSLRRQAIRRARDIMVRAADEAVDPKGLIADAASSFERILSNTTTESRFKLLTAAELDSTDHSVNYLVDGILVEGQPCMVGGVQKTLKTSLALALFVSLAVGGMFLGRFKVNRRCRTLLLSGESGLATITETLRRIAAAEGHNLGDVEGLHVCSTIPRLDRDEDLAELRGIIKREKIEVVGIDPIYLCMPSTDTANLFAQGELLRRVGELCESEGATLILLHHAKKATGMNFDPIELADLSYSGFGEFARQWLLIGRREKYTPGTGVHRLWISAGGSAGHSSLFGLDVDERRDHPNGPRGWKVELLSPDDVRKATANSREDINDAKARERLGEDKASLARTMAKHPNGETKTAFRTAARMSGTRFNVALAELLNDGTVVTCDVVKANRKNPLEGYKLA